MAETQNGTYAVAWGLPGGLTISGLTTSLPQSINFNREADEATVRNARGQTVTEIWFDHRSVVTIEVVVASTTIALAKAANVTPTNGTVITLADSASPDDDPELCATHSGKFVCVSASKTSSNSQETRISLTIRQRTGVDIAVAIS